MLKTCTSTHHCHCVQGVPMCHDGHCHCLFAIQLGHDVSQLSFYQPYSHSSVYICKITIYGTKYAHFQHTSLIQLFYHRILKKQFCYSFLFLFASKINLNTLINLVVLETPLRFFSGGSGGWGGAGRGGLVGYYGGYPPFKMQKKKKIERKNNNEKE